MGSSYKDRARKMGAAKKEGKNIKLKEGSNCLRVLPTPAGKHSPEVVMEYLVHYDVGPDKRPCRCGHEPNKKKKCWLCDEKRKELQKKGKASRAAKLEPKVATVVQASVVTDDDGKLHFGPGKPWMPTGKTAGALLTQILGSKIRDYVDAKKGYNINIERTGTGWNDTRYGPIEPDDESTKVPSSIIDALKPFDEVIPAYDEAYQKAAYAGKEYNPAGKDSESESSDDEDESSENESGSEEEENLDDVFEDDDDDEGESSDKKKDKKKKSKNKKESESSEDDDDEDGDDDEEEEDEDESSEDESGDDEDDDDEDGESESEEKPKSKKKKK